MGVFFICKRDFLSDREAFDKLLGINTAHNLTLFGFRLFDRYDLSIFSICRIHGKVRVIAVCFVLQPKKDTLMYRYSIYRTNRQEGYLLMDKVSLLII